MRTLFFTAVSFCTLFCFNSQAISQQSVTATTVEKTWEQKVAPTTQFDFGDVKPGTELEPFIELKNHTSERFVIESVSSSCGCMKAIPSTKIIEPNTTEKLTIQFDTVKFIGRRSASIHVLFAQPRKEIKLTAHVNIRNLICEPEQLEFLSGGGTEKSSSQILNVKRVGSPFWKIKSIESSSDRLSAKIESVEINGKTVSYKIACEIKQGTGKSSGIQREKLILQTNDSNQLIYEIPVIIRNSQSIEVSPKMIDFSGVATDKNKIAIVRLKEKIEPKFSIEPEGVFLIENTKQLNDRTFKLEIKPSAAVTQDARLVVRSNDDGDEASIQLIGNKKLPE
jgi:hypothetical protein